MSLNGPRVTLIVLSALVTALRTTFRFGPGRLSRRHNHTKRLRELRARRSTDPVRGLRDRAHVSRGSSGGKELPKARKGGTVLGGTRESNKRLRASSGEACQLESQRPPPEHPAASAQPILQQPEPPTFERIVGEGTRSAVRHPFLSRGDSGLHEPVTEKNQTAGTAVKDGGSCRRINVSIVPLGSLGERPSLGTSGRPSTAKPSQILPVRSAPVSWRPLAASTSASGALSQGGSQRTPQVHEKNVPQQDTRKQQRVDATALEAAGEAAVARNDEHASPGSLAESKLCYPSVADTCGGVILRLTAGERSLEPWGTSLAPLRAMCDIDPSLSRAGQEYRGVIHAVEGAQDLRSHQQIKVSYGDVSIAL